MKLLFLACLSPKTGNCTTAERIRAHIESAGHTCELRDAADFKSSAEVASLIEQKPPFEGAIAIHLFKGGRLLLDTQVPFGVVFGGTDINEDVKVEQKRAVMEQVLLKARFAVAFTDKLKAEAEVFLLSQSSKIYVQPQGIKTEAAQSFCWSEFLRRSGVSGEDVEDLHVFLLVCGLRRVKDPLYLLEAFSEWHTENPLVVLIIIGPKIDPVFTEEVEAISKRSAGVYLAQERSQEELHAAMRRSAALVNSSVSEGMSAAILEAMDLEVPVVARDIPGNTAVVQHEVTGLLYSSPQEFVRVSQRLLVDGELRERVVANGKRYVEEHHSLDHEREAYQRLVDTLH
ncbi:glycosyltransferase 1 domain-containing protein 1 isoform X2 [Salvelinus fontinalis]|uniref:Glycosyltransferase 1 domain-containing protein 1 isoform X1 n=3 Tax=Salmoninae TaxID=504568 RepID=A0A8U1F496_SALNM|nr:glycosyltransferase 1 domain-containing protein 1 isoform X2 [Salmo salar]XP_021477044.2 glycosyltransferase 1 domain-containing protein 1 isoform X2 [Oncorhynchus mykiss]XP_023834755.1 glycosyltransferase 1 domain-containing protein 1 isoform X2 [Salvelinus alpinus]XP_029618590.1 glycosyltransferase 1 domain-containing protein 1 isoform X5 [Salmo trutta]XP_038869331.1 glycosyltransferase 1 domain-containing protein 1 isoform X1 [Salvelinus namaycush]XP_055742702.1 glycosyltransferase 1 dom|eukprot:XP_014015741.1 PREDICTED: glycosyltransferase 1 domain-containing protein 1 [Salmo salar]